MTTVFEQAPTAVEAGQTHAHARLDLAFVSRVLLFALVVSIWMLGRPYAGISHDARIYIGRVIADLRPEGLGREAVFAFDGQTQLSGYSLLCRPLVQLVGPDLAAFALTAATLAFWLTAAAGLAERLVTRRLVPAAIICAAMLPATYGPLNIFSFGEAFAVPRGMAEACVLFALICLFEGRRLAAFACIGLAAFMHVPTAVAGAGVAFLFVVEATPVLWLLAPLGCGAIAASAMLHIGPAKTLFQAYDPAWLAVMKIRNSFLFVSDWSSDAWGHAIVPAASILIAAMFAQGRVRFLLLASILVAVLGVGASYLLGDLTSSTLILQLQLWRALWLVKVLGVIVVPFCAVRLWSEGRTDSRFIFLLLAAAWCVIGNAWIAAPISILAVAMGVIGRRLGPIRLNPGLVPMAALLVAILAIEPLIGNLYLAARVISAGLANGWPITPKLLIDFHILALPLTAITLALLIRPPQLSAKARLVALAACTVSAATCAAVCWLPPTPAKVVLDGRARLSAMIGPAPNGVMWVANDTAPWFLVERPTWTNFLQGTVGAFSRPLAMRWDLRSRQLVASGLGTARDRDLRAIDSGVEIPAAQTSSGVVQLCHASDGPSVIVTSRNLVRWFGAGQAQLWSPTGAGATGPDTGTNSTPAGPRRGAQFTVVRCTPELALAKRASA